MSKINGKNTCCPRVKLRELVSKIGSGFTPLGGYATYQRTGIPLIRSQNVHTNRFELDGLAFISTEQDLIMEGSRVQPRDVLLNITGASIGRVCVAPPEICPANVNQHVCIIRCAQSLDAHFLAFYLSAPDFQCHIDRLQAGATRQALTKAQIETFEVPLMELKDQRRIAAQLREQLAEVSQARGALEAQIAAAESLPAAHLRAVFQSPESERWPQKRIEDFADTRSGTTPSRGIAEYYRGKIPWVKTGELKDGLIEDTEEHVSEAALRDTSLKLLPAKTLLIAMYGQGQTRGRTGLLGIPATTNQACFAILPNPNFKPEFLQYWFQFSYQRLRNETEGRGGNQSNLNGLLLNCLSVPLPPLAEQDAIVTRLDAEFYASAELLRSLRAKLAEVEKLPAALLRAAFQQTK